MQHEGIKKCIEQLENHFKLLKNNENGLAMSKYMKGRFSFFGIKSTERKLIQRNWISTLPKDLDNQTRWEIIRELWTKEEREFHYTAIDWLNSWNKKLIEASDATHLEWLITNHSWWDSVDALASNYVGKYCQKYPAQAAEIIEKWRNSDNMWLNRTCLIFQLKYGNTVDFELLKSLIRQYQPVKEFFIQKAIGWALRQFSKFNPDAVREFIAEINLQGLARKEASKYV
jgi:3-methyladenine DNA glycosylase AlkD